MAYTKWFSDWKDADSALGGGDESTPIDQAALDHIEAGIFAAAAVADAAEVAGVAIPKAIVDAKGDLIVGTAADTVARLAAGSTAQVLSVSADGSLYWATLTASTPALTAALPGSPNNGDEIILVDSLTAPTYSWHLRYISAKASNKWVCVGGSSAVASISAAQTRASTAFGDLATVGPSFTVPVAGDYEILFGSRGRPPDGANDATYTGLYIGASPTLSGGYSEKVQEVYHSTGNKEVSTAQMYVAAAVAASTLIKLQYANLTGTATWGNRWLKVTPIAVGG